MLAASGRLAERSQSGRGRNDRFGCRRSVAARIAIRSRLPISAIRFATFPRTESPADFLPDLVGFFERHEAEISTRDLAKGLTSDEVLTMLRPDLSELGFSVEAGKRSE